jgi:spore coat protein A, manganese oxidase
MRKTLLLTLAMLSLVGLGAAPSFGQQLLGSTIPKYVTPLPYFGPTGVAPRIQVGSNPVTISMEEFSGQVLPAPLPMTKLWGYAINGGPATYPAITLEAQRGVSASMTYLNNLGNQTLYTPVSTTIPGILPVDQTLHWADPNGAHMMGGMGPMTTYTGPVPTVVHLHGGEVRSDFDGGPDAWFTPDAQPGHTHTHGSPNTVGPAYAGTPFSNIYNYPNTQEAATVWFHDHALGVTRLNVYAGLAGYYFIRDAAKEVANLPSGAYELEFAIQDRMFRTDGQLLFPNLGINPTVHPFWLPEFFGDVIVVNGKTWPFLNVEPRRYRFRILNGSNARFYELRLTNRGNRSSSGPAFWVIGTDGGYLDVPVSVGTLLIAPGERYDVIIDFAAFQGQTLTMVNGAKAPFPKGVAPDPQTVGQIAQFVVAKPGTPINDGSYNPALGATLRPSNPIVRLAQNGALAAGVVPNRKRQLTLNEVMGALGPLEVLVNNSKWDAPTTEQPVVGSTEVWEIVNLTADAHPIHLHLVQFQLLNRQPFNTSQYLKAYNASFPGGGLDPMTGLPYPPGVFMPGFGPPAGYANYGAANAGGYVGGNPDVTPFLQGKARPAEPYENGWKDTFIMYPGEVTRVVVRWAPQDAPLAASTPGTNLYPFNPWVGPGYVWHCHIIDHEDNEMMRRYTVSATIPGAKLTAKESGLTKPKSFELSQNYPNPFNPTTEIRFALPEDSRVQLKLYNTLGQEVLTLLDNDAPAGNHTVNLDATKLASGVYFYRLQAGSYTSMKKMTLLK